MAILDAILYRTIKVYANANKVIFSLYLRLFPEQRQEIPAYLAPKGAPPANGRIPRVVWQTNYTRRVTKQVFMCFRFNRFLSSTYEYHLFDDEQCDRFVQDNYPGEINRAYKRLRIGASKADFWRILVLLKHGGIYLDIDANFTARPEKHIDEGTENVFISVNDGEITNYFMASAPGNPVLQEVCDQIVRNINDGSIASVYEMTGPIVLDAVVKRRGIEPIVYKKVCVQGQFTNKKGQYADNSDAAWTVAQTLGPIVSEDIASE